MGPMTLVALLGVVLQTGAARGQNHQDPQENNDFNHHNNVVVKAASAAEKARQLLRPQLEEQQNDRQASIDNLLEDSVLSPTWAGAEESEESGCAAGTWLTELDVCLTGQQLQHFLPLTGLPLPNTVVGTGLGDRQLVLSAMAEWERVTCIRFRPATADDKDFVAFRDGRRCSTNIGRVGGQQMMTLAQPCRRKRILIHELGHVLGLIHEHQRQDRDNYVTVMLHNVRTSNQERYQFSKLAPSPQADGLVQYSYTSIMHYGKNYFAKTPDLTTLVTADPGYQDIIGRAELPAVSDAEALNIMYGCGSVMANRLPDATCELLKLKGECHSLNRDTLRSLCSRTCLLGPQEHATSGLFQPSSPYGHDNTGPDQQQQQPASGPIWAASSNAVGGPPTSAGGLGDSLLNYQQTAAASERQALWSPGLAPEGRQLSLFGNAPQPRAQPSGQDVQDPVSSWLLSLQRRPAAPHGAKTGEEVVTVRKAAERGAGGPDAGGPQEAPLAAHNMKALSPEALPEAMARLTPNDYPVAAAPLQATEPGTYVYDRPQELGLLQSMLAPHQPLPTRPALQGLSHRRPVFRPASAAGGPGFASAQRGAQGFVGTFAVSQPVFHARSALHNQPETWQQQQPPPPQTGAVYGRFQPPPAPQSVGGGAPASYPLLLDTANGNNRNPVPGGASYPLAAIRPDHSFFG